ncbi:MAG: signal peptidase I [Oscillospiraceae bacterium]|nr:signal peptidase I [Oscillospiraceae bacterium]
MSDKTKLILRECFEWFIAIAAAFAIAFLLRQFVFTLVEVRGPSMENTLHNKNRLFVYRLFYQPHNGDIVVFDPPHANELYIKRVIAIEGQTVNIDYERNVVYVDGEIIDEPYIKEHDLNKDSRQSVLPTTVPAGHVFVMGDNRNHSLDSRYPDVGMIENKKLLGKAVLRVWPFKEFGGLYNYE